METLGKPAPDVDLSVYVLVALDDHLADLQRVRDRLRANRSFDLGGRRALVLEGVASADRFTSAVRHAIGAD